MRRSYQTEIVVAEDRHLVLQLPVDLPAGKAVVTVTPVEESESAELRPLDLDFDDDIEWWEEFGGDGDDAPSLAARLGVLEC